MTPSEVPATPPSPPAPGPVVETPGPAVEAAADRALPTRLELPAGLVGLPALRRFRVRPLDGDALVELVCLDDRSFAAVAARLSVVAPEHLNRLVELGLVGSDDLVLVLLAAHGDPPAVTVNLAGPIVVEATGRARQLVVEDPAFPVRAPLGRV